MNWLPAHKNCPVIQTNILPFKTILWSTNCFPTSPFSVVLYFCFGDPHWCHLITLLFGFPLFPATIPPALSHVPQLLTAVISPFSDPSSCSLLFCIILFPLKLLSSNAEINFSCPFGSLLLWLVLLRHHPAWFRICVQRRAAKLVKGPGNMS